MEIERFPGVETVQEGIEDLHHGVVSVPALLVSIGAPRLRRLRLPVPKEVIPSAEIRLYRHLAQSKSQWGTFTVQRADPAAGQL